MAVKCKNVQKKLAIFVLFCVYFGSFYAIQSDFLGTQIGDLGTQKVDLDGQSNRVAAIGLNSKI